MKRFELPSSQHLVNVLFFDSFLSLSLCVFVYSSLSIDVILSTVHQAKGLQFDHVVLADDFGESADEWSKISTYRWYWSILQNAWFSAWITLGI